MIHVLQNRRNTIRSKQSVSVPSTKSAAARSQRLHCVDSWPQWLSVTRCKHTIRDRAHAVITGNTVDNVRNFPVCHTYSWWVEHLLLPQDRLRSAIPYPSRSCQSYSGTKRHTYCSPRVCCPGPPAFESSTIENQKTHTRTHELSFSTHFLSLE